MVKLTCDRLSVLIAPLLLACAALTSACQAQQRGVAAVNCPQAESANQRVYPAALAGHYERALSEELVAIKYQKTCVGASQDVVMTKRLADFFIYAGWYAHGSGNKNLAVKLTSQAIEILQSLRMTGTLRGQMLDEVLDDVNLAKRDLAGGWPY